MINKPLVIGRYLESEDLLAWLWSDVLHARMALIGSNSSTEKRDWLKKVAAVVSSVDSKALFWIKGKVEEDVNKFQEIPLLNLIEFESVPSLKEGERKGEFNEQRHELVNCFLELLALLKGIERKDLLPLASFRTHQEGPLAGYLRAIDRIGNDNHREWVKGHFESLKDVCWYYSERFGFRFHILKKENPVEEALEFLKAIWSYWALCAVMSVTQQMMLVIEPPTHLLEPTADPKLREIMAKIISIASIMTNSVTCSLILNTETLYPVPLLNIRYQVFFQTEYPDFDLNVQENRLFFPLPILREWETGNERAVCMFDAAHHQHTLGFFDSTLVKFL